MGRGNYCGHDGGNRGHGRDRNRGRHEQGQGRTRAYNEQARGRGRDARGGHQMGSSSSNQILFQSVQGNQPRQSGQHQFTGTGAPDNQPVSQDQPPRPSFLLALQTRLDPASSQQQGRGLPSTVLARPPQQQGRGSGVGTAPPQHGGGNKQQEVVGRPPPRSSDARVLLGKINTKDPENRQPMGRPDRGNTHDESISLLANHFPVKFEDKTTILHYDLVVQQVFENQPGKPVTDKSHLRMIREQLLADKPAEFPIDKTAYDGNKNIFSAVVLPSGDLTVNCSNGDDAEVCKYTLTFTCVAELELDNVTKYVKGNLDYNPREVLQGMDLVMKENPRRCRISVGRCFYSKDAHTDLGFGVAAHTGFQQSLKPTAGGLALCLDTSELALPKPISVIDFLKEYYRRSIKYIFEKKRADASDLLTGLKVTVNHHRNKQKFVIRSILPVKAKSVTFCLKGRERGNTREKISLLDYFWEKYKLKIELQDFPSVLDIGKEGKENYVPVEFCVLVEGQRFSKDCLTNKEASPWRKKPLPGPVERRKTICNSVQAEDGPRGTIPGNFKISVDDQMTSISGHILPPPILKLGGQTPGYVNDKTRQWKFDGKSVVEGKALQRWALIVFNYKERGDFSKLKVDEFVEKLKIRYLGLGINMEEPAVIHFTDMNELSAVGKVENLLKVVSNAADRKIKGKLQIIVCVMASKHNGYKYLKWVSETKIGIVTQCCLSSNACEPKGQFLVNLCLKINAKLGGSNMELMRGLPNFRDGDNVMFIGADVNHPTDRNGDKCPSVAAVVATINWPAANKYAARVRPQEHRTEKILNFGSMCADLVNTYEKLNSVKPNKIVVFRDGVSESQFDMVLNEELHDLAKKIYISNNYQPAITLVVAQKRHHTRLFPENDPANVHPGTVVDTKIVHPFDFDFYLCSHYGQLGTSKPTHYHVLYDENGFSSNDLQQLIYNMCFTFARCTKPVSLVPPVYYADLVAYRGRMFQEMRVETKSASATPSPNAGEETKSASATPSPNAGEETKSASATPSPNAGKETKSASATPSPNAGKETKSASATPSPNAGKETKSASATPSPNAGKETKSASATPSPNATSLSSSSSPDSLEENFYGLHSDLRNIMFFV